MVIITVCEREVSSSSQQSGHFLFIVPSQLLNPATMAEFPVPVPHYLCPPDVVQRVAV